MGNCFDRPPGARPQGFRQEAFTLLELLVVLVLLSIMLSVAIPRFRTSLFSDPLKRSARQVVGMVNEARQQAAVSENGCFLTVAIDSGQLTLDCPSADEDGEEESRADSILSGKEEEDPLETTTLPAGIRVLSLYNGKAERFTTGEPILYITPRGLMEPTVINLGDGARQIGMRVSPFLPTIEIADQELTGEGGDA